ncbi:hypothetical protein [Aquimarina algiphila]|uniref:hypothetical protein n=1 Tax=Aquimarina algiphila TaxID=2047982 RepID=UPI00232A85C4|nr:hypothetical protein [Aquimarina algiphila]
MLQNILNLEGVQTLERTVLIQVKGGHCAGNESGDGECDRIFDANGQEDFM